MITSRKLFLLVLFFTASTLLNPVFPYGNAKRQEKLSKYKTPQLVYFVDTVIKYLEKNKDLNPRHLTLLKKCQITLNSNKNRLIGIEVVNIKKCTNLSTAGIYNVKYNDVNPNRINIFVDNNEKIQNPLNRNDDYLYERETDDLKNQIEKQLKDQKLRELEELKVKQIKEQKELKEKQLKDQKVRELEKMLEELKKNQLKEQKTKESRESNIKDKTDLLFN